MIAAISLVVALFAPFPLWLVEQILPYPYVIEEVVKALLIYFVFKEELSTKTKIFISLGIGALFGLSESMLYLFNFFQMGNVNLIWPRLIVLIPFHAISCFIIAIPGVRDKRLVIIGLVLAIVYHFTYNTSLS